MTKSTRIIRFVIVMTLMSPVGQTTLAGSHGLFGRGERGSGDLVTNERDVDDFTRIECSGSMNVMVKVGSSKSVSVTFDDNLIDYIITEARSGTLEIYTEESFSSREECTVEISIPHLESVSSSGSGDFEILNLKEERLDYGRSGSGDIVMEGEVGELEIEISGSGDVDARDLAARDLRVRIGGSGDVEVHATRSFDGRITGSGDIWVDGEVDNLNIKLSGSGDVDARNLIAKKAHVRVSGSGIARVHVTESLDGRSTGSGDISYYGDPSEINVASSGSGEVRRKR